MSVTRPVNLPLPFANSGSKNTIPVASQIGITNGLASYTDGFPPLTMTPIAAGGTPPFGQDMNGALFAISAHTVFQNAGGMYQFDAALATAVGGYAVGAVLQSNDGLSAYYNILAANTTDFNTTPASIGVSWIPFAGKALVTNVIQSSSSQIGVVTGTANAIVVTFTPAITAYTNGMTLRFKTTAANTAAVTINAGGGVVSLLNQVGGALISGDLPSATIITATYDIVASSFVINSLVTSQYLTQASAQITAVAGGTADALTAAFTPAITAVSNQTILVRAASANATPTPTINPGPGAITIVKGNNLPLVAGDIAGAGHWLELTLDATLGKAVLQNPATGVSISAPFGIQGSVKNLVASASGTAATVSVSADEIIVESAANAYQVLRSLSLSGALTTSGANGIDDSTPQNFTITIASPGVVTLNNHGFVANSAVVLATTGSLPTGLTAGTTYYVVSPTTNTLQLSATKGGAAINTTGSQSGTQTIKSVLAASTWYSRWIIWNGATSSLLWSSSATNPVLPSGYTHKARCGWDYTDSSGNKYPLSFQQYGRKTQYKVASGSNVTALPILISGTQGSTTVPTWVSAAVGNFVPPTASGIGVMLLEQNLASGAMAAPNNSYGVYGSTTNPPPLSASVPSGNANVPLWMNLESTNVYYASSGASAALFCLGWEDNI